MEPLVLTAFTSGLPGGVHCAAMCGKVVCAVPGLADLGASLDCGEARFKYAPSKAGQAGFRPAVKDAGFDVK